MSLGNAGRRFIGEGLYFLGLAALLLQVCESLELHGFVLVGGDGSNSNAALMAEYFHKCLPSCCVIGVPKTIDGDLKNEVIEASFGFDTAAKTYSELIGNLCIDVNSSQTVYHFVRVMGRSASHLVLECAMQARPNLVFIGEEVERKNQSLQEIVQELVDLVVTRAEQGKMYGVILVPEGLIEFIPEMKALIAELNAVLKTEKVRRDCVFFCLLQRAFLRGATADWSVARCSHRCLRFGCMDARRSGRSCSKPRGLCGSSFRTSFKNSC